MLPSSENFTSFWYRCGYGGCRQDAPKNHVDMCIEMPATLAFWTHSLYQCCSLTLRVEAFSMSRPAIAQLVEHLTVDICSNQMVPGSIPGGRIYSRIRQIFSCVPKSIELPIAMSLLPDVPCLSLSVSLNREISEWVKEISGKETRKEERKQEQKRKKERRKEGKNE